MMDIWDTLLSCENFPCILRSAFCFFVIKLPDFGPYTQWSLRASMFASVSAADCRAPVWVENDVAGSESDDCKVTFPPAFADYLWKLLSVREILADILHSLDDFQWCVGGRRH